jgi:hypothetical protein
MTELATVKKSFNLDWLMKWIMVKVYYRLWRMYVARCVQYQSEQIADLLEELVVAEQRSGTETIDEGGARNAQKNLRALCLSGSPLPIRSIFSDRHSAGEVATPR